MRYKDMYGGKLRVYENGAVFLLGNRTLIPRKAFLKFLGEEVPES